MIRRHPRSTRTDTLFPYTTLFRSLTPSAVSQQIHALEDEMNATLFDRSSRPPKLTPQGLQVIDLARTVLRMEDDVKLSLRGDRISGTLMLDRKSTRLNSSH